MLSVWAALSVGADEAAMAQADIYADAIGLAFQIRDDVLDIIGNTEELGKPVGSDKEQQKATFATVLGVERAPGSDRKTHSYRAGGPQTAECSRRRSAL